MRQFNCLACLINPVVCCRRCGVKVCKPCTYKKRGGITSFSSDYGKGACPIIFDKGVDKNFDLSPHHRWTYYDNYAED